MQFFGKSDVGLKRHENQDSFLAEQLYDNVTLCLVCDGMGGANGGSTASKLACSSFLKYVKKKLPDFMDMGQISFDGGDLSIEGILKKGADSANSAVFKKATKNKDLSGMGTTLVAALIINDTLFALNIGDSRLYFVSENNITQLTRDHSYVQTLIDLGQITPEEAAANPHKNIITKAIGISKSEEPDLFREDLASNDVKYILLCSDGLTNFVEEEEIHSIILADATLEEKCNCLINRANENGGGDNITTVIMNVRD